jgi:hypothetical protein
MRRWIFAGNLQVFIDGTKGEDTRTGMVLDMVVGKGVEAGKVRGIDLVLVGDNHYYHRYPKQDYFQVYLPQPNKHPGLLNLQSQVRSQKPSLIFPG